jgi:hypothetical protein
MPVALASPLLFFVLPQRNKTKENGTFLYRSARKRSQAACFVEAWCSNVRLIAGCDPTLLFHYLFSAF